MLYALCAFGAHAAPSSTGLISNVQSYSSNPFNNPNSPYNQKMPTPIYATGTSLNAGDCMNITYGIISNECGRRNNCAGLRVSDIRPVVMQQLAAIPGANYVTQCAGFIDGMFDEYIKNNPAPVMTGARYDAPVQTQQFALPTPPAPRAPEYLVAYAGRGAELESLRAQTAPDTRLTATAMPQTFNDLSFVERQQILREGMEPFKDTTVYHTIRIETDVERWNRELEESAARKNSLKSQGLHVFCIEYPEEQECTDYRKRQDYCGWCKANRSDCIAETEAMNKALVENACIGTNDKVKVSLYGLDPDKCVNNSMPKLSESEVNCKAINEVSINSANNKDRNEEEPVHNSNKRRVVIIRETDQ